jgi:hypothetical protein
MKSHHGGRTLGIFCFTLPLILAAFTYLWNSADYPSGPSNDEGIYIRRAMHVLSGFGPQEALLYDHPYFAQLFMAGVFYIINYPTVLNPTVDSVESIKMIFQVPRIIMAAIALVDTALVYLISKYWYNNRTIAIAASTFFAVMPFADPIRRVLLESVQLPFFLLSILFAVCSKKISVTSSSNIDKRQVFFVMLSGVFLGLAIFTKIPIFTMIPLIVFIIYKNSKIKKILILWVMPVIIIPLLWPAYALYKSQLNLWFDGIHFQTHRGVQTMFDIIKYHFQNDPVLLSLGLIGIAFSVIKKDSFILIWTVPFIVFLYFVGFVSYWHIVPLVPLFCIAASSLIYNISQLIHYRNIQKALPFVLLLGISIYSIYAYGAVIMTSNNNSAHYHAVAFIVKYLNDNAHDETGNNDKIFLISNPFYSWIPKYVFNLDNYQAVDYLDNVSIKAKKVLMLLDSSWEQRAKNNMLGDKMTENYKEYSKNKIAAFGESGPDNYSVSIYAYDQKN